MKKIIKIIYFLCACFSVVTLSAVGYFETKVGDFYCVTSGHELVLYDGEMLSCKTVEPTVTVGKSGSVSVNGYTARVSLFGLIPVKNVNVTETAETQVAVLGTPFGIKMFTEGVLVVGYSDVETDGGLINPARESGIKKGDIILRINGINVNTNSDVQSIIKSRKGQLTEFIIKRDQKEFALTLTPVLSKNDNVYKIGVWIRDSSAGIGTLTFYEPKSKVTAGLGHGICDTDTGELVPVDYGQFVEAKIVGIKKASNETTGELQGVFSGGVIAEITANSMTGVYGECCGQIQSANVMEIALKQEVKVGKAQILTTLDDDGPKLYDCEIKKVYHNDSSKIKNMVIEVTDQDLINKTGGIVQGMSGSPIIQNGKLIGAVTHVFLNNCRQGYAIFAENMLESARSAVSDASISYLKRAS